MYPKIEEMNEIIDHMDHLKEERDHLKAIFGGLYKRQSEVFDHLKEKIIQESNMVESEIEGITVALVDAGSIQKFQDYGLDEMCEGVDYLPKEIIDLQKLECSEGDTRSIGILFWMDDYDGLINALGSKYKAEIIVNEKQYEAEYYLRETKIYIEAEEKIHKIAVQYEIPTPMLYNPMARRALEVFVRIPCEIKRADTVTINLQLAYNQLKDKLKINSCLIWNVAEKSYEELPPPKTDEYFDVLPLWDMTFITYNFSLQNDDKNLQEYILVSDDVRVIKKVGADVYWQMQDNCTDMRYKKISIRSVDDIDMQKIRGQSDMVFLNGFTPSRVSKMKRIRSKGDVFRVVASFGQLGIKCVDVNDSSKERHTIYTYSSSKEYYPPKDTIWKNMNKCKICFEKTEDDKFFIDKVSYILSFLNYYYPEFRWTGEC